MWVYSRLAHCHIKLKTDAKNTENFTLLGRFTLKWTHIFTDQYFLFIYFILGNILLPVWAETTTK